jgi:hypothetical protein
MLGPCLTPTWHLLDTCFGAPLARCHIYGLAYVHQLPVLCAAGAGAPARGTSYWGTHAANAPPTGGTHSASRTPATTPRPPAGTIFDGLYDQDSVIGSDGFDGFYDECESGCCSDRRGAPPSSPLPSGVMH